MDIKTIHGPPTQVTDSIFWSDKDESVYYADFFTQGNQSSIYRYDVNSQQIFQAYVEGVTGVSYLVPVKKCKQCNTQKDLFLIGAQHNNSIIQWDGHASVAKVILPLFNIEADVDSSRMERANQNHQGDIFVGTTHNAYCSGPANSSLYTYTAINGPQTVATGFKSTTGLTFRNKTIYHVDICKQTLTEIQQNNNGACKMPIFCVTPKYMFFSFFSDSKRTVLDFKKIGNSL